MALKDSTAYYSLHIYTNKADFLNSLQKLQFLKACVPGVVREQFWIQHVAKLSVQIFGASGATLNDYACDFQRQQLLKHILQA